MNNTKHVKNHSIENGYRERLNDLKHNNMKIQMQYNKIYNSNSIENEFIIPNYINKQTKIVE